MKTTRLNRLLALLTAMVLMLSVATSALSVEVDMTKSSYDAAVADLSSQTAEGSIQATSGDFAFTVNGQLPAQARLDVATLSEAEAQDIHTNVLGLPALEENQKGYAFDISIYSGLSEWQPDDTVTVNIAGLNVDENSEVQVYHIPDAQPAVATFRLRAAVPASAGFEEVTGVTVGNGMISFEATGFSTYYVVAGTSEGSSGWDTSITSLPGETSTYYVEPGTIIEFTSGSFSGESTEYIKLNNRTFTVSLDAPLGATAGFIVNSRNTYTITFIVADRNEVVRGAINEHPLYLALKTDAGLPSEPGVSTGDYSRVNSSYASQWTTFANTSTNYILPEIQEELVASVDGSSTVGVYDATGTACLKYLKNIDWDKMMDLAVSQRASATDGVTVNATNRANYVVIPYVIKLMAERGLGWHIDCIVVPATRITLSYNLNLNNYVITDRTLVLPNAETGTNKIDTTVGSITNLAVGTTVSATLGGVDYDLKFLGWSTDPGATTPEYLPGNNISITEDTILYAVWEGERAPGTLAITKNVTTENDTYTAPAGVKFTFTVTFNSTTPLTYTIKAKDGTVGAEKSISSGGTIELADGETATITKVPVGSYTVTEAEVSGYVTSAERDTGVISGNTTSNAVFTNLYLQPTGSLKITKTVPAVSGDVDQPDATTDFSFTVVFDDGKTYSYQKYDKDGNAIGSLTAGNSFTLQAGQYVIYPEVEGGVKATVTETEEPYYTAAAKSIEKAIVAGSEVTADFTNTYTKLKTGSIEVTKQVNKSDKSAAETFTFTVSLPTGTTGVQATQFADWLKDNSATITITLNGNETTGTGSFTGLPVGSYVITEAQAAGYKAPAYSIEGGVVVVTAEQPAQITVTNTAEQNGAVEVTKLWVDESNAYNTRKPITLTLMNGDAAVKGITNPITLNASNVDSTNANQWNGSFVNVPLYDGEGNRIVYTVKEDEAALNDYEASYDGLTVTNTLKKDSLTISKTIVPEGENTAEIDATAEFTFTVTLPNGTYNYTGSKSGSFTISDETKTAEIKLKHSESVTIDGISVGADYTVTETDDPDDYYTVSSTGSTGKMTTDGAAAAFTNTYKKLKTGNLQVNKTVLKSDMEAAETFEFTISLPAGTEGVQKTQFEEWVAANGNKISIFVSKDGTAVSGKFEQLPVGNYEIVESGKPANTVYTTLYGTDQTATKATAEVVADQTAEVNVTNIAADKGDIIVQKIWVDESNKYQTRKNISLELTPKNGDVAETITLTADDDTATADQWNGVFTDVELYDDNGDRIDYTVIEAELTDYEAPEYTSLAENDYEFVQVTNTLKQKDLTITKTVEGDKAPENAVFQFMVTVDGQPVTSYVLDEVTVNAVNGVVRFVAGNSVTIPNVNVGAECVVEEINIPVGFAIDVPDNQEQTVTMDSDGQTVEFKNVYTTGNLVVSKTVDGLLASSTQQFTFTLDLKDDKNADMTTAFTYNKYTLDASGDKVYVEENLSIGDGGTFTLTHGQYAEILDLPTRTVYTVAEEAHASYAKTVYGAETGSITVDGAEVAYTNTYKSNTLTIKKTGMASGENAIFVVKNTDETGKKYEVVVPNDGSVTLTLPEGTYSITETGDWTWRYTTGDIADATITYGGEAQTREVKNTPTNDKWLDSEQSVTNKFTTTNTTK